MTDSPAADAQRDNFNDDIPLESPSTPPPPATLQWIEQQLGHRVVAATPLAGGMSSAVHRLTLDDAAAVVLRRFTLASWLEDEPHVPGQETRTLALLGTLDFGVATPILIVADPDATHCDVPAIVMAEVPGRPNIEPADAIEWSERLAKCLARMHEQPVVQAMPRYRRWDNPDRPVPSWTTEPDLWRRAKELVAGPLPRHPDAFLHRDFHPNNVHWDDAGQICGVVDWVSACTGPVAGDLSHCRWNLAMLASPSVADHFTDHYRQLTGYREELLAFDLSTVLSGPVGPFPTFAWNALGRSDLTSEVVAVKIDAWMHHLVD